MHRLISLFLLLSSITARADYADYFYLPPDKDGGPAPALDAASISAALAAPRPVHILDRFAGKRAELEAEAPGLPLRVGVVEPFRIDAATLLGEPVKDANGYVFTAEVWSEDAHALRIQVDLSGLRPGEEVFLVEPESAWAHGPYAAAEDLVWLPTVEGSAVLLVVYTAYDRKPDLGVTAIGHLYRGMAKAALSCPIPAACAEETAEQEVLTGVARLMIPVGRGLYACTGALLNNEETQEQEPYLISAHHCFDGDVDVPGVEVFWDYRAASCESDETPFLSASPRSKGGELLAHNECLDGQFLRLDNVPNGVYGRAWLGWDTRIPVLRDAVSTFHHPGGKPMKAAFGRVVAPSISGCLDFLCLNEVEQQIQVQWEQGITENGSSGSPLLLEAYGLRVAGMLSNGAVHDCDNPEQNIDNFAAFRLFYPQIQCYLRSGVDCEEGLDCPDGGGICPLGRIFGASSTIVRNLQQFRDRILANLPGGQAVIGGYYTHSEALAKATGQSPALRGGLALVVLPAAFLGDLVAAPGAPE